MFVSVSDKKKRCFLEEISFLPSAWEGLSGFWKVLESFGKLSKLVIPFSRTWKAFEKMFFKMVVEKFGFLLGELLKYPKARWPTNPGRP